MQKGQPPPSSIDLCRLQSQIFLFADSTLPCFAAFGEQTAQILRDRFQQALPHSAIGDHVDRLIMSSMGSNWTRLYDSVRIASIPSVSANAALMNVRSIDLSGLQFQYYSQSIL
jgi:hypothetical protein